MVLPSLTTQFLRNEVFWIGICLYLAGVLTTTGDLAFGAPLIWLGSALLMVRLFLGIFVILRTAYAGLRYGYVEGKRNALRRS